MRSPASRKLQRSKVLGPAGPSLRISRYTQKLSFGKCGYSIIQNHVKMVKIQKNNHLSIIINHLAFGPSTLVESALQIRPFLQNKANFRKSQINVNDYITKDYEKKDTWWSGKNEPNTNPKRTQTNPIKANLQKAKMNVNNVLTKEYEKKLNWALGENEANSNPIQTQYEPKTNPISRAKKHAAY